VRRLLRWALNGAAALSLLLFVVTCVLWVRSYSVADAWGWARDKRTVQVGVARGRLRVDTTRLGEEGGTWPVPGAFSHARYPAAIDPPTSRSPATPWNFGFATEHRYRPGHFDSRMALIPLWLPALALVVLSWWLTRRARWLRRRDRLLANRCPSCGYDLRATPEV
jgi:hypothetical protein